MLMDVLALIGVAAVFALVVTSLCFLAERVRNVLKVAGDYRRASDHCGYVNTMKHLVNEVKVLRQRLYKAELNCSNARHDIRCHVRDYKHTKTAKKVAIDKERKQLEKEQIHDSSVRGGDGQ